MNWLLLILFAVVSGLGDAQGFSYATKIWEGTGVHWYSMLRSYLGFLVGAVSYWLMVRSMHAVGIQTTELQTIIWFAVTIICVAVLSGQFVKWQRIDQFVAVLVLMGVGWLLVRVGG